MVDSVLTQENGLDELLRPEPLASGALPEQRVVSCGISWQRYLEFDKWLGDERSSRRLYYLDGQIEIMTTSREHERLKKWIAGFLEDYLLKAGVEATPHGQATMRLALKQAGAEPDESWCIGPEKELPDLVLEIALTSGGLNKLEIYRRFQVPEVWFWRQEKLQIFILNQTAEYELAPTSRLLPGLDIALFERCLAITSWPEARRAFRQGLAEARS